MWACAICAGWHGSKLWFFCCCCFFLVNAMQVQVFIYPMTNPFPNDEFQTSPNWKSVQTTIFEFNKNGRKFSKRVENTVEKGEIAIFHSVFKRLVLKTRKIQGFFGKGLSQIFRLVQIERIWRRKFLNLIKMAESSPKVLQKGRKHWKRRNCLLRAISSFSTVFSKD